MLRDIQALSEVTVDGQFGGKALHLAQLARAGFPVPKAFCIAQTGFERYIHFNQLEDPLKQLLQACQNEIREEALEEARHLITSGQLVPSFSTEVALAYAALGAGREPSLVSVRSSARQEDSSGASFAGLHDTSLNIQGLDTLYSAIKAGWASYFSDRAVSFRKFRQLPLFGFEMGLIVQQMLEPEISGVLFTLNPITGSRQEMLLEAGWGLGEAFVSGQLAPDTFFLARPRLYQPYRNVKVVRQRLVDKPYRLAHGKQGSGQVILLEVPPERRSTPAVSPEQAASLGRMGLQLEKLFGTPQDVEWVIDASGRTFVLQARPVTTGARSRYKRRSGVLWTQRFSGERWTEPVTPLSWSILEPVLHHFTHFDEASSLCLEGAPPTKVVKGMPYVNLTIFRHLLWKFPGQAPPQFILELFPSEEQEEILKAAYILPDVTLVSAILSQVWKERRWERYCFNFLTNFEEWERFLPGFLEAIDRLPDSPGSPEEALAAVKVGQDWIRAYIRIHLLSLLFANLYYQLLIRLLNRWVGEGSESVLTELLGKDDSNKTVEANRALLSLASSLAADPDLRPWLSGERTSDPKGFLEALTHNERLPEWEAFLERYGHRSASSWEIFSPRWADDLELLLSLLSGCRRASPQDNASTGASDERLQTEARVFKKLGGWGNPQRTAFSHVLEATRRYMALRENQRFYFDKLLFKMKRILLALGRQLEARGVLERPSDIALLTQEELEAHLAAHLSPAAVGALLTMRREERRNHRSAYHPVFVEGDGVSALEEPVKGTLKGLGISSGRATGPVRIIQRLKDMHRLEPGDILVTRAVDPGWTPLFLTAAGLVTELGSLLSHGAVVAREYKLPAVVNISGATTLLTEGQRVTIDGYRGMVYVHSSDA